MTRDREKHVKRSTIKVNRKGQTPVKPSQAGAKYAVPANRRLLDECTLLDRLIECFNLKNDAHLAAWLGVDKSLIYATRAGRRRLGLVQRLKIFDRLGDPEEKGFSEVILPKNLIGEICRSGYPRPESGSSPQSLDLNIELVDLSKTAFGFKTDADLAYFLEIEPSSVATIRRRKSALGPKPRLRILAKLTQGFDADALLNTLDSSTELAKVVEEWARRNKEGRA